MRGGIGAEFTSTVRSLVVFSGVCCGACALAPARKRSLFGGALHYSWACPHLLPCSHLRKEIAGRADIASSVHHAPAPLDAATPTPSLPGSSPPVTPSS